MASVKARLNSLVRRAIGMVPPRLGLKCLVTLDTAQGNVEPDILHLPKAMPRKRVAVDIGANNGATSLLLAREFARVHSFEANPDLAERARKAVPANVSLQATALSNKSGTAELRIPVTNGIALDGWASLQRPQVGDESDWRRVRVESRTLDSFAFDEVDLIKIDVEGHELAVLAGANETISRNRPWLIVEVWDESRSEVISAMAALGYQPRALRDICGIEGAPNNLIFLPA